MNQDKMRAWYFAGLPAFVIAVYVSVPMVFNYVDGLEISTDNYKELESIRMYSVNVIPEYRPAVEQMRHALSDDKITNAEFTQIKKLADEGLKNFQERNRRVAKENLSKAIGPVPAERE